MFERAARYTSLLQSWYGLVDVARHVSQHTSDPRLAI